MRGYEDLKYEQWRESVESLLPGLLKRNLLVKKAIQPTAPTTPTPAITASLSAIGDRGEERTSIVEIQGGSKSCFFLTL